MLFIFIYTVYIFYFINRLLSQNNRSGLYINSLTK